MSTPHDRIQEPQQPTSAGEQRPPGSASLNTNPLPNRHRRLGQVLISAGFLSEDQLRIALHEQNRQNQPIGRLLVALGFIAESALRHALSESLGERSVDLTHTVVDPKAIKLLPRELAKRHRMLPLDYNQEAQRLVIAVSDPHDLIGLDRVRANLGAGMAIEILIAGEQEIARAIDQHYGHELSIDGILHELETGEIEPAGRHGANDGYHQPVVRLIDAILVDAVKQDASDIHFEPEAGFLRIR
jgi:general secretion pathway protein E/type IV pilus assembly protein PilB